MNLLKSQRGGISIFQCIIFTALLILTGVIVDATRIMVADRKIQSAVNASARSALAGYDTDLVGDYGLFGLDTSSKNSAFNSEFNKYLKANIQEKNKNFNFIKYEIDERKTYIEGYWDMLDNSKFKSQIVQYMKYRAPVSITQNVINKFTNGDIKNNLQTAKDGEKARAKEKENESRDKSSTGHKENDNNETTINEDEKPDGKDVETDKNFVENLMYKLSKSLGDSKIDEKDLISEREFESAKTKDASKYAELQKNLNLSSFDDEDDVEAAEQTNKEIFKFLDDFFASLSNATREGSENVFVVEYIMDRFTFLTSDREYEHQFSKGEVEYILWGNEKSEYSNILKTKESIWFLRFAIDSIDYFRTSLIPSLKLRLVYALGRGFVKAFDDSAKLYNGQSIAISPSTEGININYSDHLRMFLLFQSMINESGQLNNMRQLIQVNIRQSNQDFKLGNHSSALYGSVTVKVNLLFMPLLQLDKISLKNFEGGKYVITKEVFVSY